MINTSCQTVSLWNVSGPFQPVRFRVGDLVMVWFDHTITVQFNGVACPRGGGKHGQILSLGDYQCTRTYAYEYAILHVFNSHVQIHQRYRRIDRPMDDMRSQDRALHYSASRGKNWLAVDKVVAKISGLTTVLAHPVRLAVVGILMDWKTACWAMIAGARSAV